MKKKLVLATVIATLTAGLSMFSGVPAFANEMDDGVVVAVNDSYAVVAFPNYQWDESRPQCRFCVIPKSDSLFATIAEQVRYGDVICWSDETVWMVADSPLINGMSSFGDGAIEIVGSVLDEPFECFSPVTVDGQTFIQIPGAEGMRYVLEDGADCEEIEDFWGWECCRYYTGIYYDKETGSDKYSEELANEYNRESGHSIWVLPNEDGDVNSDDKVDSADAAVILEEVAQYGVGDTGRMNVSENKAADVNGDGKINAQDAAVILSYSAQVGSGMLEGVSLKAYAAQ